MFSHLRYFFWASVLIIVTGAGVFGWHYRSAANELMVSQAEDVNIAMAQNFNNTLWVNPIEKYKIDYFYKRPISENKNYQEYVKLVEDTQLLIKDMPIVKFNLYTSQEEKFFSVNQNSIFDESGRTGAIKPGGSTALFGKVLEAKKPLSEIIYDSNFTQPSGKNTNGVLVRTIIPLYQENAATEVGGQNLIPEVVVEIYFVVSKTASTLQSFQYWGALFIIITFLLLYLGLILSSKRAEKIIVRQHETNLELAGAKVRAETENQAKSQFLANISHELRTPLNAIIGFSEIIKDEVMGPVENEQYKNYVRDIHSSGVHLLSLINDILDYSKAEAGKLEVEYEDIDARKLIINSLRLQEPRARHAEVNLIKELPEEPVIISSDVKRMKQILLNILSNAVKFTPAGGSVKISIWKNLDGRTVCIEVKDTGIGIAPKDIAKALAPFGQVDSELSRRYEGTGLGLPLTKKFVELLGGELKLESQVNKGTTVTVTLPINNSINMEQPVKRF